MKEILTVLRVYPKPAMAMHSKKRHEGFSREGGSSELIEKGCSVTIKKGHSSTIVVQTDTDLLELPLQDQSSISALYENLVLALPLPQSPNPFLRCKGDLAP